MGMDLSGRGGFFQWNNAAWRNVLKLGQRFGWEPTGTGPPRGVAKSRWSGTYVSNDGALFCAQDARNLANALARALKEIPAKPYRKRGRSQTFLETFGGWGRPTVTKFIRFCRKGNFRIY